MSKPDNVLATKSFEFAVRIVDLYKYLLGVKREFVLSRQLLKAGTAIGAMINEAEFAESRADFIHKFHIAIKEANETVYWLRLLFRTGFIDEKIHESMRKEGLSLIRILGASLKTLKSKTNNF